jgi:hypothetical protein
MEITSEPLFAIVGSVDPNRNDYDPPLQDAGAAQQVAEAIGSELARRGCRIIVYSSDATFIEAHVVRGFATASKRGRGRAVEVRVPFGARVVQFPVPKGKEGLFDYHTDTDPDWEASFFRSLRDADGVILIGGGRSTFITGHVALGYRLPILALPSFGGAAQKIWRSLQPGKDLVTEAERNQMSRPGPSGVEIAVQLVEALIAQHARGLEVRKHAVNAERAQRRWVQLRSALALLLAMISISMAAAGVIWKDRVGIFQILLYLIGPVAGTAGALMRSIWPQADPGVPLVTTVAQGFVAGLVAAVLYLLAQLSTAANAEHVTAIALLFALVVGMTAGFTFDKVFRKMAQSEVEIRVPRVGHSERLGACD